ncbi:MAG: hypothetical protein Q7S55_01060 [Nanoarchaeota archaeon]|nr:hypothetical protein [Nanoarchaeota archaeon]
MKYKPTVDSGKVTRYEFTVDSKEVLAQKGDFSFVVGITKGVDPNQVRSALDQISPNIGYATYMRVLNNLGCVTDQKTWAEQFGGKIPPGLEKLVYSIHPNIPRWRNVD